jgi:DNA repair protein RecO (recombination protein O)
LPLVRAEGFVLRAQPLGDADKIVTFFTREEGKIRGVAKSARRSRRRFGSSLEPWSRVSVTLFEKESAELARVDACDLLESAYRLQEDPETACLLAYLAEVTDLFARDRQSEPHFYRLLGSLIEALREGLPRHAALRYFEVWTLKLHGLLPDLGRCGRCSASLSRGSLVMEVASGLVLCRRCGAQAGSGRVTLGEKSRVALAVILRRPPGDLGEDIASSALSDLGRMTTAALGSFAEAPFRSSRFLAVAEGSAR